MGWRKWLRSDSCQDSATANSHFFGFLWHRDHHCRVAKPFKNYEKPLMTEQVTFTYAEVELMVKEAGDYAYAQGKIETQVKIAEYLQAMILHPTKPGLALLAERIKGGIE